MNDWPTFADGGPLVLGLDPGVNRTGFALVWRDREALARLGADKRARDEPLARRFARLADLAHDLVADRRPDLVVVEQQVNMRGHARANETAFWMLVAGALRGFDRLGCPPRLVQMNPLSLKVFVMGKGGGRSPTATVRGEAVRRWPQALTGCEWEDEAMACCLAQAGLAYLAGEEVPLVYIL